MEEGNLMKIIKGKIRLSLRRIILMIVDSLCVIFSVYGALLLRFNGQVPQELTSKLLVMLIPMMIVGFLIFWFFRLYHSLW